MGGGTYLADLPGEGTTPAAPAATRSTRHPRPAATYRGARRNAWRDDGGAWPATGATYRPYKTKADRIQLVNNGEKLVRTLVPQNQPKTYPAGWRTPAERKARVLQFPNAEQSLAA